MREQSCTDWRASEGGCAPTWSSAIASLLVHPAGAVFTLVTITSSKKAVLARRASGREKGGKKRCEGKRRDNKGRQARNDKPTEGLAVPHDQNQAFVRPGTRGGLGHPAPEAGGFNWAAWVASIWENQMERAPPLARLGQRELRADLSDRKSTSLVCTRPSRQPCGVPSSVMQTTPAPVPSTRRSKAATVACFGRHGGSCRNPSVLVLASATRFACQGGATTHRGGAGL